jgi:hypothetical protein
MEESLRWAFVAGGESRYKRKDERQRAPASRGVTKWRQAVALHIMRGTKDGRLDELSGLPVSGLAGTIPTMGSLRHTTQGRRD